MRGLLLLLAVAAPAGQVRAGTPDAENVAKARAEAAPRAFEWLPYAADSFARAKAEGKVVLIDCAAEWCHWCHVMDETTYRDARVGAWLARNAITIRVDIDERLDLAERYGEWGWPATILLSPDAQELGKFRGYVPPERLLALLEALDPNAPLEATPEPPGVKLSQVPGALAHAMERLDFFYDEEQGSWGLRRKVPIGMNVLWELRRATTASRARADFSLKKQRALIDPVWGGVYQYSGAATWHEPHFEKLASYQAANLEAWARGFIATRDDGHLEAARAIFRYLTTTLRSPGGTFWVNQDADLNAHAPDKPFVDGHVYYALDDAGRRALGMPWVDTHVYAATNGQLITALVAFAEAGGEGLDVARTAADALAKSHVLADGAVKHEAGNSAAGPFFLDDAASLGLGYARLAKATGEPRYAVLSGHIAARLVSAFVDPKTGLFFDSTPDADAVGVFARRGHGFAANVTATRLLAAVGERARGRRVLAALSNTERIDGEWAWVGDYLLAADELGFRAR